jgi:hypothetical protein
VLFRSGGVSLTGTNAIVGDTVQLYNNGTAIGSAYTITTTDVTNGYANVTMSGLTPGTVYTITSKVIDTAGNASSASGSTTFTESLAGQSIIDLGTYGQLINGVQVEGKWYYHWDRDGDGTASGGYDGDATQHGVLDGIFNHDINGVTNTTEVNIDGLYGTTYEYRYATLNGVKLALPTINGGESYPELIGDTMMFGGHLPGTSYTDSGVTSNGTTSLIYNDFLAIWDAYNGTSDGASEPTLSGTPTNWWNGDYWTAERSSNGTSSINFDAGIIDDNWNNNYAFIALQVL